jgi:hypothetical protein
MATSLYLAAALMVAVGIAHSYLGERYLLMRLFRKVDVDALFGGTDFARRTLRFAWHATSIAWWGFAAILALMAGGAVTMRGLALSLAVPLLATAAIVLFASRGRHLAWPVFLVAGCIALAAG